MNIDKKQRHRGDIITMCIIMGIMITLIGFISRGGCNYPLVILLGIMAGLISYSVTSIAKLQRQIDDLKKEITQEDSKEEK